MLLHGNECVSVNDLNLQSYEVLCFEALFCSVNHIKNVLQELPHHITEIDTHYVQGNPEHTAQQRENKRGGLS